MSDLKKELYDELKLKLPLTVEGVNYDVGVFDKLLSEKVGLRKKEYCTRDKELVTKKSYNIPYAFTLAHGFSVGLVTDKNSPYKIVEEHGVFALTFRGEYISDITFSEPPKIYSRKTKDGVPFRDLINHSSGNSPDKSINIQYSTECSVKDKGQTCLFCVLNGTKGLEGGEERPAWKYPHQIAEAVKVAYEEEDYKHLNITGGFIPERDVARRPAAQVAIHVQREYCGSLELENFGEKWMSYGKARKLKVENTILHKTCN